MVKKEDVVVVEVAVAIDGVVEEQSPWGKYFPYGGTRRRLFVERVRPCRSHLPTSLPIWASAEIAENYD